jgi:quinol monooxygenase YgiN
MPYVLIRQRFTNYLQWRANFDSLAERREALGVIPMMVARDRDDPAEAVVLFRYDDDGLLRQHLTSPELAEAHRNGGVVEGSTRATFLDEDEPHA